jgi:hypothetical protein
LDIAALKVAFDEDAAGGGLEIAALKVTLEEGAAGDDLNIAALKVAFKLEGDGRLGWNPKLWSEL